MSFQMTNGVPSPLASFRFVRKRTDDWEVTHQADMAPTQQTVIVSSHDLQLGKQLKNIKGGYSFISNRICGTFDAWGSIDPSSLSILIVKDLPADFKPLRIKLLSFAFYFSSTFTWTARQRPGPAFQVEMYCELMTLSQICWPIQPLTTI